GSACDSLHASRREPRVRRGSSAAFMTSAALRICADVDHLPMALRLRARGAARWPSAETTRAGIVRKARLNPPSVSYYARCLATRRSIVPRAPTAKEDCNVKKVSATAAEALSGLLHDGMTIAAGGFGLCGIPENLIQALL